MKLKKFLIRYYGGQCVRTFLNKSEARFYAKRMGWIVDYIREV